MGKRGSSSISLIAVMLVIILFIIFPLMTVVYENYYIGIISREIVESIDASMSGVFGDVNLEASNREFIDYGIAAKDQFASKLKDNLALDDNLEADGRGFEKITLMEFQTVQKSCKDPISNEILDREIIHIRLKVFFHPIFIAFDDDEMKEVIIHYDYKVPIDN